MEKVVKFAESGTTEVWSPLSTGTLGASMAGKDSSSLSPINSSNNVSSSNNDEFARPTTPTRSSHFSSTPFILSASTSSPNLLVDKTNPSVFSKYRDSPKSKMYLQNSSKLQEHVKVLQTQLSSSEQRQEVIEKENAELRKQVKLLQDHIVKQESGFNLRIEEAVKIEDENAHLSKAVEELRTRLSSMLMKLNEAEGEVVRTNSDMDSKLAEIASLQSELKSSQNKVTDLTAALSHISAEDERLVVENQTLQQSIKTLENELSVMRTRCQDKHDLMIAAERQRDVLEDKLRQCERKLAEFEDNNGLGDNMSAGLGNAAASSQVQLHIMSQLDTLVTDQLKNQFESIFNKKISELAQVISTQNQAPVAQSFVPSAPASIAGNDFEDVASIKAESVNNHCTSSSLRPPELEQFSSLSAADATITSNGGTAGLGNIGSMLHDGGATSTWKKPAAPAVPPGTMSLDNSTNRTKVIDWLPIDPENEEIFEEEARWRDREFVKRTAIGAANRKRLIQQEESRPSFPHPPVVAAPQSNHEPENPNDRISQLAERNRRQPMHMRSAYPIEESTFLVSENDLRTGKALSVEGLAAVSSTPLHAEQGQQQGNRVQQLRARKVPVARPVSLYTPGTQPSQNQQLDSVVTRQPAPSSIPKPTQMIISPPNRTRTITPNLEPDNAVCATSDSNKENTAKSALMIISPPARNNRGQAAKPVEPETKPAPAPKNGAAFIISPPTKNPKAEQRGNKGTTKSTSTPKKFIGAVVRAFGSSSSKNTGDQKTDM